MNQLKEVYHFLNELSSNNTREWMQDNKPKYLGAKKDFEGFIKEILDRLSVMDPDIPGLEVKDCTFRINRDIRFSKDKSPYKNNFGAYMGKGGKKGTSGGYYVHLQPGQTFVGGGIWHPEKESLSKIRQEIDYNPEPLLKVMGESEFSQFYGAMGGEKLKTAPKGYPKDHENVELLKHKDFVVSRAFSDKEVFEGSFIDEVLRGFSIMKPMKDYFAMAIED